MPIIMPRMTSRTTSTISIVSNIARALDFVCCTVVVSVSSCTVSPEDTVAVSECAPCGVSLLTCTFAKTVCVCPAGTTSVLVGVIVIVAQSALGIVTMNVLLVLPAFVTVIGNVAVCPAITFCIWFPSVIVVFGVSSLQVSSSSTVIVSFSVTLYFLCEYSTSMSTS